LLKLGAKKTYELRMELIERSGVRDTSEKSFCKLYSRILFRDPLKLCLAQLGLIKRNPIPF